MCVFCVAITKYRGDLILYSKFRCTPQSDPAKVQVESHFGALNENAGQVKLNAYLATRSYVNGFTMSKLDAKCAELIGDTVHDENLIDLKRWLSHVQSFGNRAILTEGQIQE